MTCSNLIVALMSAVVLFVPHTRASTDEFSAVEHKRQTIYHSPQTPGFTSWVGAWAMPDGSLMTCFTQATGPVKDRPRAPDDVQHRLTWPPEGIPGYDMTGLDLRNVHLRSTDSGNTWKQVSADAFKSCMNGITGEAETALCDGTVLRGVWGYYLPYNPELPKTGYLERSSDGTLTWGKPEILLDPGKYSAWPKRIRVLRDGRLIVLGGVAQVAANSRTRDQYTGLFEPLLLVSSDNGKTWKGPISVVPAEHRRNWGGEECDAAELPNGDLLCVFRRVDPSQGNREVRWQGVLKRSGDIWVPDKVGPAPFPHSGHPELLATSQGPILHVATNGIHWTSDAGKKWHRLEVPGTAYYPRSVQASDGRIFVFGHVGGDDAYGKVDQSIVMDSFRLLRKTPQPKYGSPTPRRIHGRVALDANRNGLADPEEKGVAGVAISDGYTVVKTAADGQYAIEPSPSAVFINLTRPSGYDVSGDWYKPLDPIVDFSVQRSARSEEQYTFIHVTDAHISGNRRSLESLSRFVREVNALAPPPCFVLNSGDLLNLHKALSNTPACGLADMRSYVGVMNHLNIPYYNVAGDHTDSSHRIAEFPRGDHRCGKPLYWEHLGPNFFSFEYGRLHFVSVDFVYHLGKNPIRVAGQSLEYPTNMVQPMHVEWMKQDMAARTAGTYVVTTAEHDLGAHCPGFLDMAKKCDVRLQLIGDDHIVAEKQRPVPYRIGGALAGCWWNLRCESLCPDLSPQGYMIYRVNGEEMDCFYKGLGQRVALVSHRLGAVWKGRVELRAHVVQPRPGEVLEYSLDGRTWTAMREVGRPFYRALYAATIDSTALADDLLNISVKSTATGERRSQVVVVANGAARTTFSDAASLTFTVGKVPDLAKAPSGKVDVRFNDKIIGVLAPNAHQQYSFVIPASDLKRTNTLSFGLATPRDGMSLSSPVLTLRDKAFRDPRDEALRRVRVSHWGSQSADWGGFIVGDGELDEGPFHRKQDVFCFVLK